MPSHEVDEVGILFCDSALVHCLSESFPLLGLTHPYHVPYSIIPQKLLNASFPSSPIISQALFYLYSAPCRENLLVTTPSASVARYQRHNPPPGHECNTFFSTYPDVDEVPHAHGGGNARLYGHSVEEVILNAKTTCPSRICCPHKAQTIKIGA